MDTPQPTDIPYGFCHCGCGQRTTIAPKTSAKLGCVRGDPRRYVSGHNVRRPVRDRLMEKVKKGDLCWMWTASLDEHGYGRFGISGRMVLAHRAVYEELVGPIPEGLQLDHLCRNRACVNPEHLEPVTQKENILRGTAPSALAARKTHCPQGHPYDETNTRITPLGTRACRECGRQRSLGYYYERVRGRSSA